jgi:hypothetical protein
MHSKQVFGRTEELKYSPFPFDIFNLSLNKQAGKLSGLLMDVPVITIGADPGQLSGFLLSNILSALCFSEYGKTKVCCPGDAY